MSSVRECQNVVRCPYYHRHEGRAVTCEGVNERTVVKLVFQSDAARVGYMASFCRENFRKCEICRMHNRRYDE